MQPLSSLEMRSLITADGKLKLWLEEVTVREPADNELVVRMQAAPINPSDQLLKFGPAEECAYSRALDDFSTKL
jgi:NADPH:quinone reductase-like Zn-dependent oxidoreductase